jgi:hypothetical protein
MVCFSKYQSVISFSFITTVNAGSLRKLEIKERSRFTSREFPFAYGSSDRMSASFFLLLLFSPELPHTLVF